MLDNLKDHIDNQRDDFESYPFDTEAGWDEIANKVIPTEKWPKWKIASAAACLCLVILSAFYQMQAKVQVDSELAEIEMYYKSEIDYKVSLVKNHLNDESILDDLAAMDQAFAELKVDLKDNVDNEEVVAAMMENYQLKLRILEEILSELEKENSESSL